MPAPAHPHLAALYDALGAEWRWTAAEHARLLALPAEERVAAGVAWPPLKLISLDAPGFARRRLALLGTYGRVDLHDGITPGDKVALGPIAAMEAGASARGVVGRCVGVEGSAAEVLLEDVPDPVPGWLEAGALGCLRLLDEQTSRAYRQALELVDAESPLAAALIERRLPPAEPQKPASEKRFPELNRSQRAAGAVALGADPLAVIHGPPGTGKTRVLASILRELVADGERPWAAADSNAAADHLAAQAAAEGLEVLRLGRSYRVGPAARHLTLGARAASHGLAPALRALEAEIRKAQGREIGPLLGERRKLQAQIRAQILAECQVIAATMGTFVQEAPSLPRARTAVVDEATQAIEPAIWSLVPHVQRLVLVGDPRQLGPVVLQPNNPLGRSLLERLLAGQAAPMLAVQHRMNAEIHALVQDTYGPAYEPHPAVAARRLADLPGVAATPLTTAAALWVDTSGTGLNEAADPVTRSLYNEGEALILAEAIRGLLAAGVAPGDVGVIAPYSAQVARLRVALPGVEVATVNAFQGREKEAILCSFVRSNDAGELGFVADPRRLTVAVTRPRRLLLCVGDAATLDRSPPFRALMAALHAAGAWQSAWEEPWVSAALS